MNNLFTKNYLASTMAYGVVRKVFLTHDANYTKTKYDMNSNVYKTKDYPMLMIDRAAVCVIGALTNVYLWPIYLYKDLRSSELYFRKLDEEYFYNNNCDIGFIDYLIK